MMMLESIQDATSACADHLREANIRDHQMLFPTHSSQAAAESVPDMSIHRAKLEEAQSQLTKELLARREYERELALVKRGSVRR